MVRLVNGKAYDASDAFCYILSTPILYDASQIGRKDLCFVPAI